METKQINIYRIVHGERPTPELYHLHNETAELYKEYNYDNNNIDRDVIEAIATIELDIPVDNTDIDIIEMLIKQK